MPISVVKIKKLKEEDCFIRLKHQGLIEKIIDFLKNNKSMAYTGKEITKALNDKGIKTSYGGDIKNNAVSYCLTRINRTKTIDYIQKKGNYYWFEEK